MNRIKKQIQTNWDNMSKINEENQDLVTNIVCYLRVELNAVDAEEAINDVNDILLGAQAREENLNEVVGDYIEFCKEIIDSYIGNDKWYKIKAYFYELGSIAMYMLVFFIALDIVYSIAKIKSISVNNILNMEYTITLAPIISLIIALVLSTIIVNYIGKSPTSNSKESKKENIIMFFILFSTMLLMIGARFIFSKVELYTFRNVPVLVIIAILIAVVFSTKMISDFMKIRRMKKYI